MDDDYRDRLAGKLAPETVRRSLVQAGAILTGYELVRSSIMDGVRGFFTLGLRPAPDSGYETHVLALAPGKPFQASVAWLVSMDALHPEHVQALEKIRAHRHKIAHELANLLVNLDAEVDTCVLSDLRDVMAALDRFWIGIDVQTNPDFDGVDVELDGAQTGAGILFDYLLGLADTESTDDPLSG
ncbi:hypothetical protein K6U06_19485 [Acidiferrimicrobium sp. IK]|uniref:hypothetical protein n=1 Tax=Acidiferrimicrobium sp. IK TaxID=2871700 RepID=UPI0021CB57C7|nr:hypothetical protein [Acidiferrimicrobium sp. IK]MCU4186558.1 hypothetical protein [Acidiferrimicrobium sp. IK]